MEKNKIDNLELKLQNLIAYKRQKDIPILMYHRIIETEEEKGHYDTYVTKENFEKQIQYLVENNYNIITFEDIEKIGYVNRFDKDKKYIIITFDDGYKDNYENMFPIIKKYNVKVVIFLVTDLKYNKWDAEAKNREKEKIFELMNLDEIKEIYDSGLVEFGNHTTTHLDMPKYNEIELKEDLLLSTQKIEKVIEKKVISFAYPWGNNNETCRKAAKEIGYKFAVSTETGSSCFSDDLYEIKRIAIFSKDNMKKFRKKVSGSYTFEKEKKKKWKLIRNGIRRKIGLKIKE